MNLTRKTKVEKVTEELVLEISESEFKEVVKKVIHEKLENDRKHVDSSSLMLFIAADNAELVGRLHNRLFKSDKEEK